MNKDAEAESNETNDNPTTASKPFFSCIGEEAVAVAQQRGALRQKQLENVRKQKEIDRIRRMSNVKDAQKINQKKVAAASGTFSVMPSPSKNLPAVVSSALTTSTSPFKVTKTNHTYQKGKGKE